MAQDQPKESSNPDGSPGGHAGHAPCGYQQTVYHGVPSNSGGVYISPRFKHFAQMLWTVAKVDIVIKNYTLAWFQSQGITADSTVSRQTITEKFSKDCSAFCDDLYAVFVHAAQHVYKSLHDHMYNTMLSS